ncbi:MAG: gliding motility-associated C-terminal domain-containing protein, partial [Crocinitomicaceae bacterium]|nr:gliding motility-associated C-terminal domain-containing protein [Crocinitomicaceae bacterium]
FEEYYQCPTGSANIENCKYVFNPMCANSQTVGCFSTPDYFNACASIGDNSNIPYTANGYQKAKDGNAYIGFFDGIFYREYIQMKLSESLLQGSIYSFSFYANLANYSNITTNQVGLKFVNDSVIYSQYLWQIMSPDWVSNEYITDTVDWQLLQGEYVAKGGERWIIIGNFYPDTIFPNFVVDSTVPMAWLNYYYINIDNFSVNRTPLNKPNVFTPNGDGVNDLWTTDGNVIKISILNRWGNVVFSSENGFSGWNGNNQNGNPCSEGNYFYILENKTDTEVSTHKGFITLIR